MVHVYQIIVDNQQALIVLYQCENDHDIHLKYLIYKNDLEKVNIPLISFIKWFAGKTRGSLLA
jgi:hypothetical protein